jgi:hypothetical protein
MSEAIHYRARRGEGFEDATRSSPEPEKRLMLAVLHDAVVCLEHEIAKPSTGSDSYRDARNWILAREKGHLFCFESICEALDWNADQIRERLLSLHDRQPVRRRKRL